MMPTESFSQSPESPKLDTVVDQVLADFDCVMVPVVGHLQEASKWMFKITTEQTTPPSLHDIAHSLMMRLNPDPEHTRYFIEVRTDPLSPEIEYYISIEEVDISESGAV